MRSYLAVSPNRTQDRCHPWDKCKSWLRFCHERGPVDSCWHEHPGGRGEVACRPVGGCGDRAVLPPLCRGRGGGNCNSSVSKCSVVSSAPRSPALSLSFAAPKPRVRGEAVTRAGEAAEGAARLRELDARGSLGSEAAPCSSSKATQPSLPAGRRWRLRVRSPQPHTRAGPWAPGSQPSAPDPEASFHRGGETSPRTGRDSPEAAAAGWGERCPVEAEPGCPRGSPGAAPSPARSARSRPPSRPLGLREEVVHSMSVRPPQRRQGCGQRTDHGQQT